MQRRQSFKAFTLVELLVVMAIIAILVSIMLPVVGNVTRNARSLGCKANEKMICSAMFAYAASNSGFLPVPSVIGETDSYACWQVPNGGTADFTKGTLWPYLASSPSTLQRIMKCPSDTNECLPRQGDTYFPPGNFSYSINAHVRWNWYTASTVSYGTSLAMRQVKNPSKHGMVFEEFAPNDGLCCGPGDGDDFFTGRHGPYGTTDYRDDYFKASWVASGAGNVGFFDGHVETVATAAYQNNTNNLFEPIQ